MPTLDDDDDDVPPDLASDDEHENVSVARVTAAQPGLPPDATIIDSGATHLVTTRMSDLVNPIPSPITTITGISGAKRVNIMQGSIYLCGHWFHGALCVPQALNVLVPVRVILTAFGGDVAMSTTNCRHFSPESIITILGPCIREGLHCLQTLPGHHLRVDVAVATSL